MKKLGKKVRKKGDSLQMYSFCACNSCSCTSNAMTYASKSSDNNRQRN